MSDQTSAGERRLRIVHILRSPVGGLFRHVLDLSREQIARGHLVGLIVDASTGGAHAETMLAQLAPTLALGIARLSMRRDPHPADIIALTRVAARLRTVRPDVVHGHGAKGALYARLPALMPFASRGPVRVYTPHGGSLHYEAGSLKGALILRMERMLARRSDVILFESGYAAERFRTTIGAPPCPVRVIHNGVAEAEFVPVAARPDAADILFVGELRALKGVDVLIEALARLGAGPGPAPRALLVGSGPDRERFEQLAARLGLGDRVAFAGPMPARDAFELGRLLVVPSRAESLPYIVLEAAAARMPVVASRVGGIPEIFGTAEGLVPPGDPAALAEAISRHLALAPSQRRIASAALADAVRARFSTARMADAVLASYRDAIAARQGDAPRAAVRSLPRFSRYGM